MHAIDGRDSDPADLAKVQQWFAEQVSLNGEAYTLDVDQTRAVMDTHQNCLVTARAGSGKTRVIVAKVAYLVGKLGYNLSDILIFMFNRAAAEEVNERIAQVKINGKTLLDIAKVEKAEVRVASTFHKFALDIVKMSGVRPRLINELEQSRLIERIFQNNLKKYPKNKRIDAKFVRGGLTPQEYTEFLQLVKMFTVRAGQTFVGKDGCEELVSRLKKLISEQPNQKHEKEAIWLQKVAVVTYLNYIKSLKSPTMDFNLLMAQAIRLLSEAQKASGRANKNLKTRFTNVRYIMVDEYQDFSYLFYAMIVALRNIATETKLFAVGDDWQAINRFAGSNVDYFLNFAKYFPEDSINIPLATNYRSSAKIVMNANRFMLENYDKQAIPAKPFNKASDKILYHNPAKKRFDVTDIFSDANRDGRFLLALRSAILARNPEMKSRLEFRKEKNPPADFVNMAKILAEVYRIIKKRPQEDWLLLGRNNQLSYRYVSLGVFWAALKQVLLADFITSEDEFMQNIRIMTMHKSKGLEATNVILLECDRQIIRNRHPHAETFTLLGDSRKLEKDDQDRLLYVALTRAKKRLYILTQDRDIFPR